MEPRRGARHYDGYIADKADVVSTRKHEIKGATLGRERLCNVTPREKSICNDRERAERGANLILTSRSLVFLFKPGSEK